MTGLEKILMQIKEEATKIADAQIAKANEKAKEILATAKEEADRKCAEIEEQSSATVKSAISRAESAANLQAKKLILQAKQEIITNVIEEGRRVLGSLSDEAYFDMIVKMIAKHALDKDGKILFAPKDLSRLPEQFDATIRETLKDKKNAGLTVAELNIPIDGGFVLVYGDIELNCSFESLILSAKESLQDKVCEVLFA